MDILEIRRGGRCQEFELLDPEFTLGGGEGDGLRVADVRAGLLRFVRGELGFRVEVMPPTKSVRLNGVEVERRELRHGDRIEIGPVTVAYREEGKPWPVEPEPVRAGLDLKIGAIPIAKAPSRKAAIAEDRDRPSRAEPVGGARADAGRGRQVSARDRDAPRGGRRLRPRKQSPWLLWNALLIGGVIAMILLKSLGSRELTPGAHDLVSLAETQFLRAEYTSALATLAAAEEKAPDANLLVRVRALRGKIDVELARAADAPLVRAAEADHREIQRFVEINLQSAGSRPAARELLRLAESWSTRHGAIAARNPDVTELGREIDALRQKYFALAEPGQPDRAEDVLFQADRCMRFERRRYSEALNALGAWLEAQRGESADVSRVRQKLAFLREDGVRWLAGRRDAVERMVQRGELDRARAELRALIDGGWVPSAWLGDAADRLRALEAK